MTYAPPTLIALRDYLKAKTGLSAVALGIVGNAAHVKGYHLGRDRIYSSSGQGDADYSVKTARDKAGLTNAASAIDIGNFPRLRAMSIWLADQCRANVPDCADIREVIYSPDGARVIRWDREGIPGGADNSHLTHTHVSWYRDADSIAVSTAPRDHTAPFRRFFDGEPDMKVTRNRWERWRAVNGNGVLRRNPVRSEAPFTRLPDGTEISSFAEGTTADGNQWRQVEFSGPAYLLRADFDPVTAGGDPALDAAFAGFVATGTVATGTVAVDCTAEVDAATLPLRSEVQTLTLRVDEANKRLTSVKTIAEVV